MQKPKCQIGMRNLRLENEEIDLDKNDDFHVGVIQILNHIKIGNIVVEKINLRCVGKFHACIMSVRKMDETTNGKTLAPTGNGYRGK